MLSTGEARLAGSDRYADGPEDERPVGQDRRQVQCAASPPTPVFGSDVSVPGRGKESPVVVTVSRGALSRSRVAEDLRSAG